MMMLVLSGSVLSVQSSHVAGAAASKVLQVVLKIPTYSMPVWMIRLVLVGVGETDQSSAADPVSRGSLFQF